MYMILSTIHTFVYISHTWFYIFFSHFLFHFIPFLIWKKKEISSCYTSSFTKVNNEIYFVFRLKKLKELYLYEALKAPLPLTCFDNFCYARFVKRACPSFKFHFISFLAFLFFLISEQINFARTKYKAYDILYVY